MFRKEEHVSIAAISQSPLVRSTKSDFSLVNDPNLPVSLVRCLLANLTMSFSLPISIVVEKAATARVKDVRCSTADYDVSRGHALAGIALESRCSSRAHSQSFERYLLNARAFCQTAFSADLHLNPIDLTLTASCCRICFVVSAASAR